MPKVVINACFGGFGLSHEAIMAYGARKGWTLFPEQDPAYPTFALTTYWKCPPELRPKRPQTKDWSSPEAKAYNKAYATMTLYARDIPRDDPDLVAVVEKLGSRSASGDFAELRVVEIPDGVNWEISEYDGNEHVAEAHRTWS